VALNAFNVLNHVNDVTFIGVTGSTTLLPNPQPNPQFGRAVAAFPARRLQLNLEFKF
jgi:hypothetical protein